LWDLKTRTWLADLRGARQHANNVEFTGDGKSLAACGGSNAFPDGVVVWDVASELDLVTLQGHKDGVACGAFSRDGKMLATGGFDTMIRVWDTRTWKLKGVLKGHTKNVFCIAFSGDGTKLVSGSEDGTARLWDTATCKEKVVLARHKVAVTAVAFSPDGKWIATGSSVFTQPVGEIKMFDATTLKERAKMGWANRAALSLAFSPDSKVLATGSPGADNAALQLFDVTTGKHLRTVGGAISVRHLAYSPDGNTLATGHGMGGARGDGSIQLWDTRSWTEKAALLGHGALCLSVAFARDGRALTSASTDGTARVWDLAPSRTRMAARR
jgi:WD40 repeat protein